MGPEIPIASVPFILGVSGHRDLVPADAGDLRRAVGGLLARMRRERKHTNLVLLSGLAGGADQLVARAALDAGVFLVAILPMPEEVYKASMDNGADRAGFDELLAKASYVIRLPLHSAARELSGSEEERQKQYMALSEFLVLHSQALIALWDGETGNGPGGTADTVCKMLNGVEYENGMEPVRGTVYHLHVRRSPQALRPRPPLRWRVLRHLSDADDHARAVPRWHLEQEQAHRNRPATAEDEAEEFQITPRTAHRLELVPRLALLRRLAVQDADPCSWRTRLRNELWHRCVASWLYGKGLDDFNADVAKVNLAAAPESAAPVRHKAVENSPYLRRVDELRRRADLAAQACQHMRNRCLNGLLILSFLAMICLELHSAYHERLPWHWWWFLYPLFIVAAVLLYFGARWFRIENRFLDARVLAEALRVQIFWAIGGVHKPVWMHYQTVRPSELGWIGSSLRILTLFEQHKPPTHTATPDVEYVLEHWVKNQATWYAQKSEEQWKRCRRNELLNRVCLFLVVLVMFLFGGSMSLGLGKWVEQCDKHAHLAVALLFVVLGLLKVRLDQIGFEEQARHYRRLGHLFTHWQKLLEESVHSPAAALLRHGSGTSLHTRLVHIQSSILEKAGIKALEEHSIWLLMHRERPLPIGGAG